MSYEQRENRGSLFTNERKTTETQPGWKGSARIDGVDYWVSAWVKPTKAGGKWISLAFEKKQERGGRDDDMPFRQHMKRAEYLT